MSVRERARAVAARAEAEYLALEAERIENEAEGLRVLLAAVVLGNGGEIVVSPALMDAASEFSCVLRATEHGLVIGVGEQEEPVEVPLRVAERPQEPLPPVSLPSEPPETITGVEPLEDDDTPEAREARYLASHSTPRVAQGSARPSLRRWDDPEDLVFQEVAQEQPERHSSELSAGDGSIQVSVS